ncbi:MAG: Mov34/MPN/PAD-1 family protein, partial [Isosphaeraceae bacterium]
MSGDEMVFEEIRYREPVRLLRPDRDLRYACLSYQVPATSDLPIFVDYHTADAMERHALADTSVELGGILLGKECVDEATGAQFVWITQALEAKHYANTQASFTYTHDSWEEITRQRDRLFPDLDIVGWYHTHPSFGIFLSHHDLFIHQHFFAQPLQVAYVIDPIQQTRGFFQWRDRGMAQVEGFYLTADRGERLALAKLANDLENLPSPQGQGGGLLSPRLEAELIKMLSRSSTPRYINSPVDRLQTAMTFGMLGSFLGVLAVAVALWLYQLNGRIREQNESLKALTNSVDQAVSNDRLAIDTFLEKAGTENPARFRERYERVAKARDLARLQLRAQQTINETLANHNKEIQLAQQKLEKELEKTHKRQEKLEADAKDAPDLRKKIEELTEEKGRLLQDLDLKSAVADTVEGKKVEDVLARLWMFRAATYILAALCLILAAALGYLVMR